MTVLLEQIMPEGVTIEFLDEVTAEMGVDENLPDDFVVHVHFMRDGRAHIVDIWDSEEAYAAFKIEITGGESPVLRALRAAHAHARKPVDPAT